MRKIIMKASATIMLASASGVGTAYGTQRLSPDIETFAPNDVLDVGEQAKDYRVTYRCLTPIAARAVVRAVPQSEKISPTARESHFKTAVRAQHCAIVKTGKFKLIRSYEDALMSSDEPDVVWEALAATGPGGKTVGILFNVSVF